MSKEKSIYHQYGDMFPLLENCTAPQGSGMYYYYYANLALNRFRWENLPDGITSRNIETQLFNTGQVFFTKDPNYGYICLRCSAKGFDLYGDPTELDVYGLGYHEQFNVDKGVIIRENDMSYPPLLHLLHYMEVATVVDETAMMNLQQQKFPIMFTKTSNTELSVKQFSENVFNSYFPIQIVDKNMEKALGTGSGTIDTVKALNTNVPFILNDLQDFKHDKESELYTFLGLNNANTDKKERLITSEVDANNGQIMMSLDTAFKNRQKACEEINKKYGLNIKVYKVVDELNKEKNDGESEVSEVEEDNAK